MNDCRHNLVNCLNQYDLIRKYVCESCNEIMMCVCDEKFGRSFLPHQLKQGSWYGSRERVPVTLGFQENVCSECRGEKAVPAPTAPRPGATSKIKRYYWREIYFENIRRFHDAYPEIDPNMVTFDDPSIQDARKRIEKEVLDEIKSLHATTPKYQYSELSQKEVLEQTNTETILVNAEHVNSGNKKTGIRSGDRIMTAEEFASDYFKNQGYEVLETESVPFHVLFGVFMWIVIQDADDEKGQIVQFGSRIEFEEGEAVPGMVTTILPEDFGSNIYYDRQKELIEQHLDDLHDDDDIEWLFDYWLDHSSKLRQYLWAHREKDVLKAKAVMSVVGLSNLKKVLHYMVMDYWKNFCGWPDLLVYNDEEFIFVEVKSRNDRLSEDQKNWLLGNHKHMSFTAKIFKIGSK